MKAHIALCVWIDCGGISDKHEADSSTIIISDADSNRVTCRIDHRLEVAGRIDPILHRTLRDLGRWHTGKCSDIRSKSMGIPGRGNCLALHLVLMICDMQRSTILRGIHECLIDTQFRYAILTANLINSSNKFLANRISILRSGVLGTCTLLRLKHG